MSSYNFVAEAWTLLAVSIVMIGIRLYARLSMLGIRKMAVDDGLMVFAGILYTAETVAAYFVGAYWHGLANNSMTDEQRASLDPKSEEYRLRVNGSITQLLGWLVYTVLLWTLKFCWIFYYSRLTTGVENMPVRIKLGYVILVTTFFGTFFAILFGCYPVEKHWQIYPAPGNHCQPANSIVQVATLISLNISTDLYLMSIPLPMIWKSRLPWKRKMFLLGMFGGGFLVMVFGILRCTTILTSGERGPEEAGRWSCRESFVAVMIGNLPMVYPLFKGWFDKAKSSYIGASKEGSSYHLSSRLQSSKKSGGRNKRHLHPLSIPNDTAWGSDEAIVTVDCKTGAINGKGFKPQDKTPPSTAQATSDRSSPELRNASGNMRNGIHVVQEYSIVESNEQDTRAGRRMFSGRTFGPQ
ncbi:hypothetical protein AJ79_06076 [Helicocarpus griseus UAMH5409]|uniref:Rhodopsin domain-containing protein n=1 Tax=Helicocarpus griseus UAMH5409 TaxID=1447875 RepID=A0A2B7XFZ6_9EURO|nr:hypothetical protein AJ79_06076 [Helicocarpus griseus UAMH5409]